MLIEKRGAMQAPLFLIQIKKRKQTFTGLNIFKKQKYNEFREDPGHLDEIALKDQYKNLPLAEKEVFEILAERDLMRAETLWDELKGHLLKSKGKVSYKKLENCMGGIVSVWTIRSYLRQQEGFTMRKDRILPSLDRQAKGRRVAWALTFFYFGTVFGRSTQAIVL